MQARVEALGLSRGEEFVHSRAGADLDFPEWLRLLHRDGLPLVQLQHGIELLGRGPAGGALGEEIFEEYLNGGELQITGIVPELIKRNKCGWSLSSPPVN